MIKFPYPVKFVATGNKEFNVKVTKPNKRSWWLVLLDKNGDTIKSIKVSKASVKLRYPSASGSNLLNGPGCLRQLLKERDKNG